MTVQEFTHNDFGVAVNNIKALYDETESGELDIGDNCPNCGQGWTGTL